ncbi:TauD/TfdA family dioxygenase [Streptomyces sp. H27-C3]|uniref:TauD/TfdA dioxygenase family protein n=1 Tax=Streptomyces sp. H27-C3 TaxID=3046305 RepID=UPI0024BA789C|nr:TauD/TfdA family dioxygenase [Streptomyces sp. H27-C3]MDJ0461925.1 TauD/TfdA family dioxygenase [Streptomyces sp. H27-C3]
MSLNVSALRKKFVAEISGTPRDLLTERGGHYLQKALAAHAVLVIRGLELDPAEHLGLTRFLGQPETVTDLLNQHADSDDILVVDNSREAPVVGNQCWHSDRSFLTRPTRHTLLRATVVPDRGGDTLFADMTGAYAQAPPSWRESLCTAAGVHTYDRIALLRSVIHRRPVESGYAEKFPAVRHPLVRVHPESGAPAFYLNELCLTDIEALDGALIGIPVEKLNAYATEERFVYRHRWQAGDLLIWDNARVMHRADVLPPGLPRVLHRTTTSGCRPRFARHLSAMAGG